jgi:hypothetical protein
MDGQDKRFHADLSHKFEMKRCFYRYILGFSTKMVALGAKITHQPSFLLASCAAVHIAAKASASRLAPPTNAPPTSGTANIDPAFSALTDPPYKIGGRAPAPNRSLSTDAMI